MTRLARHWSAPSCVCLMRSSVQALLDLSSHAIGLSKKLTLYFKETRNRSDNHHQAAQLSTYLYADVWPDQRMLPSIWPGSFAVPLGPLGPSACLVVIGADNCNKRPRPQEHFFGHAQRSQMAPQFPICVMIGGAGSTETCGVTCSRPRPATLAGRSRLVPGLVDSFQKGP